MKKNVYILTEEGSEYSEEGLMYLTEKIEQLSKEKNELVFSMGAIYNDIRKFSEILKMNRDKGDSPYIVISHEKIDIIYDENIDSMIMALDDFAARGIDKTSWQIAMYVFVEN